MERMYSSVDELKAYSGVLPQDFGLEDEEGGDTAEEKLDSLLEGWLLQVKNFIDQDRGRDYDADTPPGISNISLRMAANIIAQAQMRRESPVVTVENFNIKLVYDRIFTTDIKEDLSRFPMKVRFKFSRVRRADEMEV